MNEDEPMYKLNQSDALMQTAQEIVRLGNRSIALDLRQSFLSAVDILERALGQSPTTAEIRAAYRMTRSERMNGHVDTQRQ